MPDFQSVYPTKSIHASIDLPGDKSLSHRSLIFASIAHGKSQFQNCLEAQDVQSTWKCLEALGVRIQKKQSGLEIEGVGLDGLKKPEQVLDCGNSGTTMRLLMGLLAEQTFESTLIGDASLSKRPMLRVADPLKQMGAKIELTQNNFAPIYIQGTSLHPIDYSLPVASAQLKSALILAALQTSGISHFSGLIHSRDHSERLLKLFGAPLIQTNNVIQVTGPAHLQACNFRIPGDPSTAAFWIAAASITQNSEMNLKNISLNPTRLGFLHALCQMGAHIETVLTQHDPEPIGDIRIRSSPLKSIQINKQVIPTLIDELPVLAVVCTQAHGVSEIRGAEELKNKESDRLLAIQKNLQAMGAHVEIFADGFRIEGPQILKGASINSYQDHRIAMAFSIAALIAKGHSQISDPECVQISYPDFFHVLQEISQ